MFSFSQGQIVGTECDTKSRSSQGVGSPLRLHDKDARHVNDSRVRVVRNKTRIALAMAFEISSCSSTRRPFLDCLRHRIVVQSFEIA